MNRVLFTAFMLSAVAAHAQVKKGMVGINTNEPRATLHIEPGTSESKGLIIPRITAAEMVNMSNLPHFGADQHAIITYLKIPMPSIDRTGKLVDVDEPGYYYYDNTTGVKKWRKLGGGGAQDLRLIGNDNHITQDAGVGENGTSVGSGMSNIAIGKAALKSNTIGYNNVVIGNSSLYNNTSGNENMVMGGNSLIINTTGSNNIAIGGSILQNNSTGSNNFGIGTGALNQNSTGSNNFALGQSALIGNSTGDYNTGIGYLAGQWIKGDRNIHIGIDDYDPIPPMNGQLNKVIFIGHLDSANYIFDTSTANSNVILLGNNIDNEAPKVGIGTYQPVTKLDINSNGSYGKAIRIVDGTQGQGKVLTSDYNGVGTWQEINVSLFKKAPIAGTFSWAAATELGNTSFNKIASLTVPPGASMIYVKIHLRGANVNAGYTRAYVGTKDIGTNNSNTDETPIGGSTLFIPYTGKDFEMQTSFIYNNTTSGNQIIYLNLQSDVATIKRSAFEYPNGGKAWGTNWVENYFYAVPAN